MKEAFILNCRNFHGEEALKKCINAIISEEKTVVLLLNADKTHQEKFKKEFGSNIQFGQKNKFV